MQRSVPKQARLDAWAGCVSVTNRATPGRPTSGYTLAVAELQRLRADHGPAALTFELANRAYFRASISDRGDEFFDRFTERYSALLAEQEAGPGAFHVLVDADGSVLGRFNLYDVEDGTAELGYRVAQHVAGRGVATATVRQLCRVAADCYGIRVLRGRLPRRMWLLRRC